MINRAQEALRKELQVIEKIKLFKETIEKRVAECNKRAHEQESELQEIQHRETMQVTKEMNADMNICTLLLRSKGLFLGQ